MFLMSFWTFCQDVPTKSSILDLNNVPFCKTIFQWSSEARRLAISGRRSSRRLSLYVINNLWPTLNKVLIHVAEIVRHLYEWIVSATCHLISKRLARWARILAFDIFCTYFVVSKRMNLMPQQFKSYNFYVFVCVLVWEYLIGR